jgi:hypothetical protein
VRPWVQTPPKKKKNDSGPLLNLLGNFAQEEIIFSNETLLELPMDGLQIHSHGFSEFTIWKWQHQKNLTCSQLLPWTLASESVGREALLRKLVHVLHNVQKRWCPSFWGGENKDQAKEAKVFASLQALARAVCCKCGNIQSVIKENVL